jgi:hypothetical protein
LLNLKRFRVYNLSFYTNHSYLKKVLSGEELLFLKQAYISASQLILSDMSNCRNQLERHRVRQEHLQVQNFLTSSPVTFTVVLAIAVIWLLQF